MTGKNFVGFHHSAKGNRMFQTFNPVLNRNNSTFFFQANSDEVNEACELAASAFTELQEIHFSKRADFLNEIALQIELLGDKLIQSYTAESGLSVERAISERSRTLFQLRSFADLVRENEWVEASIDQAIPDRTPPKPDLRKMLFGIGTVVVFGASNFPLAYSTAGGDTAAAFAAGCPVIVKSHPMHAGTGELVASAIVAAGIKTGMPNGVFSNLNAIDYEIGHQLVLDHRVKAVGFTGSIEGGRALYDLANGREEPIPVFAEMGSTNPVIILNEILKTASNFWSAKFSESITGSSGQFCTKPGLIFLEKSAFSEQFIEDIQKQLLQKESSSMLHPSIYAKYESKKQKSLQIAPQRYYEKSGVQAENFARQTLLVVGGKEFILHPSLHEEVFGPFCIVVECEDHMEMEQCLFLLKGQLTASIVGTEKDFENHKNSILILKNRVGRIIFNGVPTGVEVCPSMNHGGPYPASTDSRFTAVGVDSIRRFARPIVFQNCPQEFLPLELKNLNTLDINRRVDGFLTKEDLSEKKL